MKIMVSGTYDFDVSWVSMSESKGKKGVNPFGGKAGKAKNSEKKGGSKEGKDEEMTDEEIMALQKQYGEDEDEDGEEDDEEDIEEVENPSESETKMQNIEQDVVGKDGVEDEDEETKKEKDAEEKESKKLVRTNKNPLELYTPNLDSLVSVSLPRNPIPNANTVLSKKLEVKMALVLTKPVSIDENVENEEQTSTTSLHSSLTNYGLAIKREDFLKFRGFMKQIYDSVSKNKNTNARVKLSDAAYFAVYNPGSKVVAIFDNLNKRKPRLVLDMVSLEAFLARFS